MTMLTKAVDAISWSGDGYQLNVRDDAETIVRAVLQAIREPNDEMICSALKAAELDGEVYWPSDFRTFVNSLLDTILAG
jgi:hypothetical protein